MSKLTLDQLNARLVCIADTRARLRESTANPFVRAVGNPSGVKAAAAISQIPMEAAAAGFNLQAVNSSDRWTLRLTSRIDQNLMFEAYGEAASLRAALVHVIESGLRCLEIHDSETRTAVSNALRREAA